MITRLVVISLFALTTAASAASMKDFVQVKNGRFELKGKRYSFLGTNFWYGASLGSEGAGGDRARLARELDRLKKLGVTNLRVLGATEGPDSEPWRIVPALQSAPGVFDEKLLKGFDLLLEEMGKRDMRAVVVLNNFWPWSGGMAQYLRWFGGSAIPYPPPEPGGSWAGFQEYTEKFYSNERAVAAASELTRLLVSRHADDPTVMAWELANEPRGGKNVEAFNAWIEHASANIRALDPNHLITTGCEGETPWPESNGLDFVRNHSFKNIDYATAHVWVQNWFWYDPQKASTSFKEALAHMRAYLHDHVEKARRLGKPLVLEEFGLARDSGSLSPDSSTKYRDRYYAAVFEEVLKAARAGSPLVGVNFWAWSGEAEPRKPAGGFWKAGDPFVGDPPHESQGWYGVYARDRGTVKVISKYAAKLSKLK